MGCAFLGSPGKATEHEAVEAVRRAIELGIDFVDTSAGYGNGESERRVGLALTGGWRERVYLQTKAGMHPDRLFDYSAEVTRWSVENSLRLLKTDYLDAVLIHGYDECTRNHRCDPNEVLDPLAPGHMLDELLRMKAEGLIRHVGIGARSHDVHRRAIETGQIEIVLSYLDYTLLTQSVAQTTLPLARQHDVGVILASVLGMGLLAGPEPDPETDRRRNSDREPRAHAMWLWCRERGVNIRHLAMQFCLAAPLDGNGIVMAGPANKEEVEDAYEAATAEVPAEVWREFGAEFGVGLET